jgi:hypothetical protein
MQSKQVDIKIDMLENIGKWFHMSVTHHGYKDLPQILPRMHQLLLQNILTLVGSTRLRSIPPHQLSSNWVVVLP